MIDSYKASRIALTVHKGLSPKALDALKEMGLNSVLVESTRCVRQNIKDNSWWVFGNRSKLIDSPTEVFRFRVYNSYAERAVTHLIKQLDLKTPGRGYVYAQDIDEICKRKLSDIKVDDTTEHNMKDLTLITGIQTNSMSDKSLSKVALKLGVCVPVVGMGVGSGIRDKLGLLRITISPEKELSYLIVPSHDSIGLHNLLIDEGNLKKPGGGFLYQTPISVGIVDPLIRIGYQEHAASFEQIIAAIDDLKQGTQWRKRFYGVNPEENTNDGNKFTHKEITLTCPADSSDEYIHAAMSAGAAGATTIHMRKVYLNKEETDSAINMESVIMCVKTENEKRILKEISAIAEAKDERDLFIQSIPAFSFC